MVIIRADANKTIATGHVMRCCSIALALENLGEEVLFVTADEDSADLFTRNGQSFRVLHSDYRRMEEELPVFSEIIRQTHRKFILVDSYQATESYLTSLRDLAPVVYVDDLSVIHCPLDGVLAYTVGTKERAKDYSNALHTYLGAEYAPLRPQFYPENRPASQGNLSPEHILITAGGGGKAVELIRMILKQFSGDSFWKDYVFDLVIGSFSGEPELFSDFGLKTKLHVNVLDMAGLYSHMSAAVSAGGSTLYELAAMEVPTVSFSFADNQLINVKEFDRLRMIPYAGNLPNEVTLERISELLKGLLRDKKTKDLAIQAMKEHVFGDGARNLATSLLKDFA